MARRNITISLPDHLAREARHMAVDRGLSLSAYVAQLLEEQIAATREQKTLRKRQLRRLEEGMGLGTHGVVTWTREELHER